MTREETQQSFGTRLPIVGYYGINDGGYEVLELKEGHVLRMFDVCEITAQPVCLLSDALAVVAALQQATRQL